MATRKTFEIVPFLKEANRLLVLDIIPQDEKKGICHLVEHVLHESGRYNGFNHNYWLSVGCNEWHDAGTPDFPEKDRFIYGPSGKEMGEFSRHYYCKG